MPTLLLGSQGEQSRLEGTRAFEPKQRNIFPHHRGNAGWLLQIWSYASFNDDHCGIEMHLTSFTLVFVRFGAWTTNVELVRITSELEPKDLWTITINYLLLQIVHPSSTWKVTCFQVPCVFWVIYNCWQRDPNGCHPSVRILLLTNNHIPWARTSKLLLYIPSTKTWVFYGVCVPRLECGRTW